MEVNHERDFQRNRCGARHNRAILHNMAAMRGELLMQINADLKSPFNERSEL
jgi:hypothetical protein